MRDFDSCCFQCRYDTEELKIREDVIKLQSSAKHYGDYLLIERDADTSSILIFRKRDRKLLFSGFTYSVLLGIISGYEYGILDMQERIKELL